MAKVTFGCSYVKRFQIDNFYKNFGDDFVVAGLSGADNQSICNNVIGYHIKYGLTYVFVMFTGLNRTSYPISNNLNEMFNNYFSKVSINDELRLFSGGTYGSWNLHYDLRKVFKLTHLDSNLSHITQNSLLACMSCINFLKTNNIPYNYTFTYNPFKVDPHSDQVWGTINKDNKYWAMLDKTNFIDDYFLFDYAKENMLLLEDNFYPSIQAYERWFELIKSKLHI